MKFSHREETRDGRLLDILTEDENGVRIIVSRLGAELISIARRDTSGAWIGFLYRDNEVQPPEKGWANHATVMGYYLHRLKDGRSFYRGREIHGGTHGFLRQTVWHRAEIDAAKKGSLTYRVAKPDFSSYDYPLNVSLDLTYEINNDGITTRFHFENHETNTTAHVSFGLHPGFAASSFESFKLRMPQGKYRRYFSPDNFLSEETEEIDFAGGEMPFSREDLPRSYILQFVDVPRRQFLFFDPPGGRSVSIDLQNTPYLTLWSDGGPFLCVEPCWGLTDHQKQRAFEDKAGIQTIPPGQGLTAQFTMMPQLVASP
ncbi:MAG: hypothetical protein QOH39_2081 [Verrucomicrobiota bacterium]|jgi:galactose mutarotase-like enzyme